MKSTIKVESLVRRKSIYQGSGSSWPKGNTTMRVSRISSDGTTIHFDGIGGWDMDRFDLVSQLTENSSVEDQIQYAKELIGKHVEYSIDNKTYWMTVSSWSIVSQANSSGRAGLIQDHVGKRDVCVYVIGNGKEIPVYMCSSTKEMIEVKLNSKYTAEVTTDGITVGCQKFPLSIVDDLAKAVQLIQ